MSSIKMSTSQASLLPSCIHGTDSKCQPYTKHIVTDIRFDTEYSVATSSVGPLDKMIY